MGNQCPRCLLTPNCSGVCVYGTFLVRSIYMGYLRVGNFKKSINVQFLWQQYQCKFSHPALKYLLSLPSPRVRHWHQFVSVFVLADERVRVLLLVKIAQCVVHSPLVKKSVSVYSCSGEGFSREDFEWHRTCENAQDWETYVTGLISTNVQDEVLHCPLAFRHVPV